jgi:hypothetical protein
MDTIKAIVELNTFLKRHVCNYNVIKERSKP